MSKLIVGEDYTIEEKSGLLVLTSFFLTKRGYCCGNKCINCPYKPEAMNGNKILGNPDLFKDRLNTPKTRQY